MLYGIILESARDGVILTYGINVWRRVVHDIELPAKGFDLFKHYNENLLLTICDCLVDILHEGTRDTYLEFFGQDFFRYFKNIGYHKLFRIAARNLREFLFVIDQLHDSNRFSFPNMQMPLFHVTEEDQTGVTLEYKSARQGFSHYAKGSLQGAAKTLFQHDDVQLYLRKDLSTTEYTHVVFWIQFDNNTYQPRNLVSFPQLSNLTGPTFFRVFPFSILMDCSLCIRDIGSHIRKLFPNDTILTGRPLDEVFRLIRPDIHVEWDKILSYGRHIVFLIENRLPLRTGPTGRIRLKGQMKYIENKNMLWFLCHPVLDSADDIMSAGLHLTDLNLFDGTSQLLITSMHQTKEIEDSMGKTQLHVKQLEETRNKLNQYRERRQHLLNATVPKHITTMIQSGIPTYSFCESYPLVTVMFADIINFKMSTTQLKPVDIVELLDEAIRLFDDTTDKYEAFRVKTKMNSNYMIVAGLNDRSNIPADKRGSTIRFPILTDAEGEINKDLLEFNSTEIIAYLSLELLRSSERLINPLTCKPFNIKIGFSTGPAVGGMIGIHRPQYNLFGDAVTSASQMMTNGEAGRIHLSQAASQHLETGARFIIEHRDQTNTKNGKSDDTYWLAGTRRNRSSSITGPNKTRRLSQCLYGGKLL